MHRALAAARAAALSATPAAAHFQLVDAPEVNLDRAGEVPLKRLFRPPMVNGHVMDMAAPARFVARDRGARTDLEDALSPVVFAGRANESRAVAGVARRTRSGDDTCVLVPAPHDEDSADVDIQRPAKNVVNRGALPPDGIEPGGRASALAIN